MAYLINILYVALILLASPYLLYQSVRKGKYREGFSHKLLGRVPKRTAHGPCVWFHAVSVGEVGLLAPLIHRISEDRPGWQCALSTTTMTGMALARRKYPQLPVFYCPLDFSWAVRTAMQRIRPKVLVLTELELWPNLIRAAGERGARVAVVNGRLSDHSFRGYSRIRPLVGRVLRRVDCIAVQDATYADRFRRLGAQEESVHVTGSMKYDGAETDRNNPETQRLRRLAGFFDDDVVLLAGSTQEPEESIVLDVYRELCGQWPRLRLVLVPRHPDRFEAVARLLERRGLTWQRRRGLGQRPADPHARILLVDTVGELGAWWATSQIAFVGGSMGSRGGQNMIEPAAYGAAVSFGPNTRNFRDIVSAMLARDAAAVVRDRSELSAFVRRCLEEPQYAARMGERARTFVASQLGATERTLDLLAGLVEKSPEAPPSHSAAA